MKPEIAPDVTEQPAAPTGVACSDWLGHGVGVPAPQAFAPPPENLGNWKHGRTSEMRDKLKHLKIGEYAEGPMPQWERQAKRLADKMGIRVATRRVKENETVRIYRVA